MTNRRKEIASRALLAALAAAAFATGCKGPGGGGEPVASATTMSTLSGTVLYRERIGLPADARVDVRLEDLSSADSSPEALATQTIATRGRQVPVPFELRYAPDRIDPNRRYGLRASILTASGELLFATAEHQPVLTQGAPTGNVQVLVQRIAGRARSGLSTEPIPNDPLRLVPVQPPGLDRMRRGREPAQTEGAEQAKAAEGAEQAKAAEGAEQAEAAEGAEANEGPWADARRRGALFRALGNEPSWVLEIHPGRLVLVTDLGARRTEAPYGEPLVEDSRTVYRASADGREIIAAVERAPCTDTMSGQRFDAAASVTVDGMTYRGCGRFLDGP